MNTYPSPREKVQLKAIKKAHSAELRLYYGSSIMKRYGHKIFNVSSQLRDELREKLKADLTAEGIPILNLKKFA